MRKSIFTLLASALVAVSANAIPANPMPVRFVQPDGTSVMLRLHGDEYLSWDATLDGYTVVKNDKGSYVYAVLDDKGHLAASEVQANDAVNRSEAENAFLATIPVGIHNPISEENAVMMRANKAANVSRIAQKDWDFDKFRGLVILIQFNDRKFTRDDYYTIINDMINKENYTGFEGNVYTGSVHDYFNDNSLGIFKPKFDVYGPVTVNYSVTYPSGSNVVNVWNMAKDAFDQLDSEIDFTKYDCNNDGTVDMVYFIFAGFGSNVSGNDSRYIWPHASSLSYSFRYDNMKFGRYACSTELYGTPTYKMIDGIGTICHEFSHVIGLCDEYDTDYATNGQSFDPGTWSVMAGGSYNNNSRTPVGYSLFERYQSGLSVPQLIDAEGDFTLPPLHETGFGYRINSAVDKEFFMIENRQQVKWDRYLPGHGMLVFRVDSTDATPWNNNRLNANAERNYYELLRAKPQGKTNSGYDAFPGNGNVTSLTNFTSPALVSYTKLPTPIVIENIAEPGNNITFSTKEFKVFTDTEDFEGFSLENENLTSVAGKFCNWTFGKNAMVVANTESTKMYGKKCVAIPKLGFLQTSELVDNVKQVSLSIYNPNTTSSVFRLYTMKDGKTTQIYTDKNVSNLTVAAGETVNPVFLPLSNEPVSLYLVQYSGSTALPCYVDNITCTYDSRTQSAVDDVLNDEVDNDATPVYYNLQGIRVDGALQPGFYIEVRGNKSTKIMVK